MSDESKQKRKKASDKDKPAKKKKSHASRVWNEFEDMTLAKEMKEGDSLAEIAKSHNRDELAIKKRLVILLGKMLKDGASFEKALSAVRIKKEDFANYLITGKFKS